MCSWVVRARYYDGRVYVRTFSDRASATKLNDFVLRLSAVESGSVSKEEANGLPEGEGLCDLTNYGKRL